MNARPNAVNEPIERRATSYQGHDFWTLERHRFVRKLRDSMPVEGPYNEGAREVFWGALAAAVAFAFLWQWLPTIVAGLVK